MATFVEGSVTWEKHDVLDPEDWSIVIDYRWLIQYALNSDLFGYSTGPYFAESSQLPAEPTLEDVQALILSIYPEGYSAIMPGEGEEV